GSGQTLSVSFTPSDPTNYANVSTSVTIDVTRAAPAIIWSSPAPIVYGTALGVDQLNASSAVDGSFTYTPNTGTVLNAGTRTLSVDFTPTDTANYAAASKSVSIEVR